MALEASLFSSLASLNISSSSAKATGSRERPFRFFDLPSELRIGILELILVIPNNTTIDLDPLNSRRLAPLLRLFLVSHRMHEEAYRVFYSANTFRLFPVHGRFLYHKRPLLARLPTHYRASLTSVELRLGPGWNAPPKSWKVTPELGLHELHALRRLSVFVEFDPASNEVFRGFRINDDFFTNFCQGMLRDIFSQVGTLEEVTFDAYPSVRLDSPLMRGLVHETRRMHMKLSWGKARGWEDAALIQVEAEAAVGIAALPTAIPRVEPSATVAAAIVAATAA